ncbi:MAG: endonuclease MutS2 [Candidatus Marinimicrobia bacterium]|nr:endonuclease MutS2 [Candidatus Neomarinimicrobiota bacterium]
MTSIKNTEQNKIDELLGFNRVKELLKSYTYTENASFKFQNLESFQSVEKVEYEQDLSLEMRDIIALDSSLPLLNFSNQNDVLKHIAIRDTAISLEELFLMSEILHYQNRIKKYFLQREESYPNLKKLLKFHYSNLTGIEKEIKSIFTPERALADNASKALKQIRKQIKIIDNRIKDKIQSLATNLAKDDIAVEEQVAFRNNRQVIPIKSSKKNSVKGIIHDQSQSGQTYYIEPIEIVEMNNKLAEKKLDEKVEIKRILKEKTNLLRENLDDVKSAIILLEEMDFIHAKGRLAIKFECNKPVKNENDFRIKNGRNLVLALHRKVVPLNISLDESKRGVIITGPNAGGKTVTLKTIGLISLMHWAGLLIPADSNSSIPKFDKIFIDIGDDQSIDGDLSTFSAHIMKLKNILQYATSKSLIILDELGTGTDPKEGSALAEGILLNLIKRKSLTFATTHHGSLKTLAFKIPELENASMTFNNKNLEPTYEFKLGIPGSSYALEIAKRYELDDDVIEYAKKNVGEKQEKLEDLIIDLQKKIFGYDELIQKNSQLEKEIILKNKEASDRKKEIEKKFRKADKDAITNANDLIKKMQSKLEKTIKYIKENDASKESIKTAQSTFRHIQNDLTNREEKIDSKKQTIFSWSDIHIGKIVHINTMNINGKILEINRKSKKIWVDINGSRMRLKLDWLSPMQKHEQQIKTTIQKSKGKIPFRIDLRGNRGDEAMAKVEKFIDNAVVHGLSRVEILHGKGFGILRELITDFLTNDPRVESFKDAPLESGGAGVTWVELAN